MASSSRGNTDVIDTPESLPSNGKDKGKTKSNNTENSVDNNSSLGDRTPLFHPSLRRQSLINNIPEGSPLKRAMSVFNKVRIASVAFSPIALNAASSRTSNNEFLEWLDGQLSKIESFYRTKEKEALERYLLLQDQLYQLRDQKMTIKKQNIISESTDIIIKNALRTKKEISKIRGFPMIELRKKQKQKQEPLDMGEDLIDFDPMDSPTGSISTTTSRRRLKNKNREEDPNYKQRDYRKKKEHSHVAYHTARRQLKVAIIEFYRGLDLLKSYRMLNRTGFRKMAKKFDKVTGSHCLDWYTNKVNSSYFGTSDVLDNLIPKVEDLYSIYFENGNRKVGVDKLRSQGKVDEHFGAMFLGGLFLGMAVPLFLEALVVGGKRVVDHSMPEAGILLQLWGGIFLVILFLCIFTINCYVWTIYKINYRFIFEFDARNCLNYREYLEIPSLLFVALALLSWLSFENYWPEKFPGRYFPLLYIGIAFLVFFFPARRLHYRSRKWLQVALWRLLFSGLYPVEFRDFFLGDIVGSLTYSMGNISLLGCTYASHFRGIIDNTPGGSMCGSNHSRLMGFLSALPAMFRLVQCLRRYIDSKEWFPHLANLGKYTFTVAYYTMLSIYRIDKTNSHKAGFIVLGIFNSTYSSVWDILMDWSLIQANSKYPLLRNELGFKVPWPYYSAIFIDIILRFNWVFYLITESQLQHAALTGFLVALSEVFRRFIWIFFRMENEHCTNVIFAKASRDVPLPYPIVKRQLPESVPQVKFSYSEDSIVSPVKIKPTVTTDDRSSIGPNDEESVVGLIHRKPSTIHDEPSLARSSTVDSSRLTRLNSYAGVSPALEHFSNVLKRAHTKDFERRKPNPDQDSSDDEKDSDEE